ncbi:hypothetical protein MP638_006712 [Amoeboaphelidium occidentale]|nr:hypothetical protein MP638_006712 [Amoeboaphelidium occidentale]
MNPLEVEEMSVDEFKEQILASAHIRRGSDDPDTREFAYRRIDKIRRARGAHDLVTALSESIAETEGIEASASLRHDQQQGMMQSNENFNYEANMASARLTTPTRASPTQAPQSPGSLFQSQKLYTLHHMHAFETDANLNSPTRKRFSITSPRSILNLHRRSAVIEEDVADATESTYSAKYFGTSPRPRSAKPMFLKRNSQQGRPLYHPDFSEYLVQPTKHDSLLVPPKTINPDKVAPKQKFWTFRKIAGCMCFVTLFLIFCAIGVGIAVINGRFDKIPELLNGRLLPRPDIGPNDPSQILIVPSDLAKGTAGCSNVPARAARRGFQVLKSDQYFEYDRCPNGGFRYTLTECDVLEMMYPKDSSLSKEAYFNQHVKPNMEGLLTALEMFDLNCAEDRLLVHMAQVKHETAGLRKMKQKIDGGAGSVHMIPRYFHMVIKDVDYLRKIYNDLERPKFADKHSLDKLEEMGKNYALLSPDQKSFVEDVGDMLARPDTTFLIGGWWFKQGSNKLQKDLSCGDLRIDSDKGEGKENPPTGFYRVTECIYGSKDPGLKQRVEYYNEMKEYAGKKFKCQTKECPKEV